ncbi:MAG: hypothetical protein MJY81_01140 [Bacteroidaceae bacterium]|nr:hypothetical protein [Bacteroidaceae bacterium]
MANKRSVKKSLGYIMSDLFTATIFSAAQEKANKEKASELQEKILKVYSDFNSRLSNYERRNAKAFFKQFKTEINAEIEAIINGIEEI